MVFHGPRFARSGLQLALPRNGRLDVRDFYFVMGDFDFF